MTGKTTLRANLAALPRAAWILYAGTFINRFGTFVIVFLVLYLTRRGYSPEQAGLALGAYGFGHFLSAAVGGYLADHIGRRRTIALSMFSAAVSFMLLAQAETLPEIIACTALTGLTADLYRAAASALLADLVPLGERLTAFTVYRLAINAGVAIGPAVGGFLAEQSFFYLFAIDAITCLIYGVIAMVALPEGRRGSKEEARWIVALRHARHDRPYLLLLASSALITFVFFQFESTFALHITAAGYPATTYGLLISLNGLLIIFGELPLIVITGKYSPARVMAIGYVLVGLGFAINAAPATLTALLISVFIWTAGEMISAPVSSAYVADLAPEHLRGRYMGLFGLTWSAGLMLGPSVGAFLFGWSPRALWISCGVLGLIAAWLIVGSERRRAPEHAQQQSYADHHAAPDHVVPEP